MVSASLEWCMIVPAVTEVCLPQPAHSQVHGLVCSSQALLLPQPGQTKPCGQRPAKRYLAQAALSGKRCWNSIRERGKSVTADHPERLMFSLCSITAHAATTDCVTGRTGISLQRSLSTLGIGVLRPLDVGLDRTAPAVRAPPLSRE